MEIRYTEVTGTENAMVKGLVGLERLLGWRTRFDK